MISHLGEENYGIDITMIREIVEFTPLTPIPKAPNWVEGILNHHGRVVTIINLSSFLDLPFDETDVLKRITVFDNPLMNIGFLLKDPLEMISEWETKAERGGGPELVKNKYVSKVIISGGRVINVLDVDRFIGDLDGYFI